VGGSGTTLVCFVLLGKWLIIYFFHCPFIVDFWHKILSIHPQRNLINVSSFFEFWNSCLSLHNFHFCGVLLAAIIWVLWFERNKRVFNTSSPNRVSSIFFGIFQLVKQWIGSSTHLEDIMKMVVPTTAHYVPDRADPHHVPIDGAAAGDDEDLLDY
jgi:hypothetical protein